MITPNIFLKSDLGKIFSGNMVVQITAVLQAIIVSRLLGPEGKGHFIEIILWPTIIAGVSILGLYTGIAKLVADDKLFSEYNFARTTLKATFIVGLLGSAICAAFSPWLIHQESPAIFHLCIFFSVFVLINNVGRGFNAIDHGRQDFTKYSLSRALLNPIFFLILLFLYLIQKLSLTTVVLSFLFANFAVSATRVIMGLYAERKKNTPYPLPSLFKNSIKYSISDLSEPIYAYYDKALLALVLCSYDLGIYTTAYSAASVVNIISNVFATKIFSDIAKTHNYQLISLALRQNIIVMSATAIGLSISLPYLIPLVFGNDFSGAIIPSILLIITCILQGESFIVERSLLAMGYPFKGVQGKTLTMILMAVFAAVFYFINYMNIYVMILIVSICQAAYGIYLISQLKPIVKGPFQIVPTITDCKDIISRCFK